MLKTTGSKSCVEVVDVLHDAAAEECLARAEVTLEGAADPIGARTWIRAMKNWARTLAVGTLRPFGVGLLV